MNVLITVSGTRASGRTTLLNWISSQLKAKGAFISQIAEHQLTIVTDGNTIFNASQEVNKSNALDKAKEIIYGDREQTYGSPDKNLRVIAEYWTAHLNASKSVNLRLTVDDVCVMMVLLKAARLANSPKHEDSLVDLIGYAALADRCNRVVANEVATPDVPAFPVLDNPVPTVP